MLDSYFEEHETIRRSRRFWLTTLRYHFNLTGETCQDFMHGCGVDSTEFGDMVRFACSRMCGCHSPLALNSQSGCQLHCSRVRAESAKGYECAETEQLQMIQQEPSLPRFLSDFEARLKWYNEHMVDSITTNLAGPKGCSALSLTIAGVRDYLCYNDHRPGLAFLCPVSCGCQQSSHERSVDAHCPPACQHGASKQKP